MPPNIEIERRFLVTNPPKNWRQWKHAKIRQGYFPVRSQSFEVRLRQKVEKYFLTVKAGHGHARQEQEITISQHQFDSLWPLTHGQRIAKLRYETRVGKHKIELDVYGAAQNNLKTAEVEFASTRESRMFHCPPWFGREITGSRKYSNRALARSSR